MFEIKKGKRLTKANMSDGNIRYIGATAFNNGITAKIGNTDYLHPAGTITVCYNGSVGQSFYQDEPFWATDDVNVLYPKFTMSSHIAHFLIPILRRCGQQYEYVNKWTLEEMIDTEILLPATSNSTPDWKYMDSYMQQMEQRAKQLLDKVA